jgi:hypothetical protein
MYLSNRIIHVDGHIIGYQFNRKSLGSRRFTRCVKVSSEASQVGEALVLGRKVRVRRVCPESKFHWEVF